MLITDEELKAREIYERHGNKSVSACDEILKAIEVKAHSVWYDNDKIKTVANQARFYRQVKEILIKMVNGK